MEHTAYLSQAIGIFMVIAGFSIMVRKHYFVPVVGGFVEERLTRMVMGVLELLAGAFLVTAHADWSTLPAGIISTLGVVLLVEGTGYLLLPDRAVAWIIRTFNVRWWYHFGGAAAVLLGAYLCFFGFGLL